MYFSPSSPGVNVTAEQKPSEDVINSVEPSLDLWPLVLARGDDATDIPCDVSEGREVQVANNAQRLLLLCVVDVDSVLSGHRIDHAIWEAEGGCWASWWSSRCTIFGISRFWRWC